MKKVYKAYDGTVFENEELCDQYEKYLLAARKALTELEKRFTEIKENLSKADAIADIEGKYRDKMKLVDIPRITTSIHFLRYAMAEETNE